LLTPILIYHLDHSFANKLCAPKLVFLELNMQFSVIKLPSLVVFEKPRITLVKVGLSYWFARFILVLEIKQ